MGSRKAYGMAPRIAATLLAGVLFVFMYIVRIEEQELAARFGAAYLAYKEQTPFLIPRLGARRPGGGSGKAAGRVG